MKTIKKISILLFSISTSTLFAQYVGYSPINDTDVSKWVAKHKTDYYGAYHFGDSEGESTLLIFDTGIEIIAQQRGSTWDAKIVNGWVGHHINLSNVNIDRNGTFSSDKYRGEFVLYKGDGMIRKGLKLYHPWPGPARSSGEYEVGIKEEKSVIYFRWINGHYAYASTQELDPEQLSRMSSYELKIMRNEIFARYGYIFKAGGEMDTYFKNQRYNWYIPQHANVDKFLTNVEKRNIKRIKAEEEMRR